MSDADRKALVMVLRSLINSRKNASINDLVRDYMETEGRPIPFQQFGHNRLDQFLIASGEFQVTANRMIYTRTSDASEHINKLVAEQNNSKRKKKMPLPIRRFPFNNSYGASNTAVTGVPYRALQQANVYANAYQNMKSRSPTKVPTKPAFVEPFRKKHFNDGPSRADYIRSLSQPKSNALPLHMSKPSFVVTFDGLIPANELARQQCQESVGQQIKTTVEKQQRVPTPPQQNRAPTPPQQNRVPTPTHQNRATTPPQQQQQQPKQQVAQHQRNGQLENAAASSIAVPLTKKSIHERITALPVTPLKITITNNNNAQLPANDLRNRLRKQPVESNFIKQPTMGGTDLKNRLVIHQPPSPPPQVVAAASTVDTTTTVSKLNSRLKRFQINNCDIPATATATVGRDVPDAVVVQNGNATPVS